ncbi:MAG: hypothetical protein SF187_00685 [Deltaproteobacteria bacterium]|nr:hypothetical protein [Deltaproteobacteria bacterium]
MAYVASRFRLPTRLLCALALWLGGGCSDADNGTGPTSGAIDAGEADVLQVQNPRSCQVARVSAGATHTCALLVDGRTFCWGANDQGQLGMGDLVTRPLPAIVVTPKPLVEIRASSGASCGRATDNQVLCWGRPVGAPEGAPPLSKPVPVMLPGNSSAIVTGGEHACTLLTDGRVFCWGRGGLVGDGTAVDRPTPVVLGALTEATSSLVATVDHTCLRTTKGELRCWGANETGALGVAPEPGVGLAPVLPAAFTVGIAAVAVGPGRTCVVSAGEDAGRIFCSPPLATPEVVGWGKDNLGITLGQNHACVITTDLKMKCAGANDQGQVGPDPRAVVPENEAIEVLTDAIFMSAGAAHTCAIRQDRSLWCWGRNTEGQVGIGTLENTSVPAPVALPVGCPIQ